ncbi:MAG: acylneuraminate cytidylyltransferase family protein [Pseudomonadales bacterium]|uniref:acylneuraminate cytidylyltransferase family protein n=1 Tax=Moritella sp. TaxID=78556 RepID=UPI001D68BA3A|nr:acylneuraminate cytidylyltransferase family protein [Moritella sp.]MCJ8314570.1 acylneuraminate cytidylyltransferase family protein [Pseudomonadales bacterium]NQZ50767.1 acylneuraminate cytidylyltransferase family protein [Moritella sp.]
MSTIATICARGGSQGLPGKNVKLLLGKPLIVYTIEQALLCPEIDYVFVSTDDQKIADIAKEAGAEVPFIRPETLSTNTAAKLPVIKHLVDWIVNSGVEVTKIVDLDPTSPLRNVSDITACINKFHDDVDVVITGYIADKNPYFNMVEKSKDKGFVLVKSLKNKVTSRQQAPEVFAMNASIYVWSIDSFKLGLFDGLVLLHEMPRERSIDVDSLIDFKLVEILLKEKMSNVKC